MWQSYHHSATLLYMLFVINIAFEILYYGLFC